MSAPSLGEFPLLSGLDPEERASLAGELDCLEVGPGYRVYGEGDEGEGLLLVAEGRVRAISAAGGASGEFGPGAMLGGLSLVLPGSRRASVETLSRSRLFLLRRSAYARLVASSPRAACRLVEALLRESAGLADEALAALGSASIDRGGAPH